MTIGGKAKSVIWVFLSGGVSHMESFDPKPALTRYAGKTFAETPYPDPLTSPLFAEPPGAAGQSDPGGITDLPPPPLPPPPPVE